jgi:hypothetical protein
MGEATGSRVVHSAAKPGAHGGNGFSPDLYHTGDIERPGGKLCSSAQPNVRVSSAATLPYFSKNYSGYPRKLPNCEYFSKKRNKPKQLIDNQFVCVPIISL